MVSMAELPNTDPPHWFWRGVQSAIFYYVSCAPCLDARHKYQRRKEAKRTNKEVIVRQPGLIQQPRAFETNSQWTEEVLLGPGPPKGWEPHALVRDAKRKGKEPASEHTNDESIPGRPSYERRISNAFENVKGTLRSSLYPERWNWKRYDREDEFLGGIQTTMTRMWDKVTASVGVYTDEPGSSQALKRAQTIESERVDYTRGHVPAVNDLHPPVVSQMPATREEASWMILPPPSAAVMAGKKPPGAEVGPRVPLCIIGRPRPEPVIKADEAVADDSSVGTSSIEVWDAASVASSESRTEASPPPRIEVKKRTESMFDTLSDTEMFKVPVRPLPRSRPHSWQFTYVIPSPPLPVHIQ